MNQLEISILIIRIFTFFVVVALAEALLASVTGSSSRVDVQSNDPSQGQAADLEATSQDTADMAGAEGQGVENTGASAVGSGDTAVPGEQATTDPAATETSPSVDAALDAAGKDDGGDNQKTTEESNQGNGSRSALAKLRHCYSEDETNYMQYK